MWLEQAQVYYRRVLAAGAPLSMHALICSLFSHYHVNIMLRISLLNLNPFFSLNVVVTVFFSIVFKTFPC